MSEDGEARFKTVYQECELVEKAIPSSTTYKNKLMRDNNFWQIANFSVGYSSHFRSRRAL